MGHLNGILARVGGNLNKKFQKSQMPGGLPGGGGMLKLRFDRYISLCGKERVFFQSPFPLFAPLPRRLSKLVTRASISHQATAYQSIISASIFNDSLRRKLRHQNE